MLVMRRRPGEAIHIGEDVEIEIIECGPNRVKLGIRAPRQVPVWRAETKPAREQNIAAAKWNDTHLPLSLAPPSESASKAEVSSLLERQ